MYGNYIARFECADSNNLIDGEMKDWRSAKGNAHQYIRENGRDLIKSSIEKLWIACKTFLLPTCYSGERRIE